MAKKLWTNGFIKEFHRNRASLLWKNEEFRQKIISGLKEANKKRLEKVPDFYNNLANKAAISLRNKWKSPEYKSRVIKSKILGFVKVLVQKHYQVTPEIYE